MMGRQTGFALIGVMVGVVIFFGGVMGVAAMHSQAIRSSHDSLLRSQGVWLAYDVAERIKGDFAETDNYETSIAAGLNNIFLCGSPPVLCTGGTTCTSAQMVEFDVYDLLCTRGSRNYSLNVTCHRFSVGQPCAPRDQVSVQVFSGRGISSWRLTILQN